MLWQVLEIPLALPVFALVLFRLSGLMLIAPVFSNAAIPVRVRLLMTVAIAAMLFPSVRAQAPVDLRLSVLIGGAVGELMIGVSIGLALMLMFSGVQLAGRITGQQIGIAIAEVFDPTTRQRTNVVSQVYGIAMLFVFLVIGGHRATMAALLDTYDAIPMLSGGVDETLIVLLVEVLTAAFVLALRLAAPVLITLFLIALTLGFLSRTMPQMNILTVGFIVRILVGLGVAALALSVSGDLLIDATWNTLDRIREHFGLDVTVARVW